MKNKGVKGCKTCKANEKFQKKEKTFKVMVTERYFVCHEITVKADDENEAMELAEQTASNIIVDSSDMSHKETESYVIK